MKVSLLQLDITLADRDHNADTVTRRFDEAMAAGPDVVVLPELWDFGFYPKNALELGDVGGEWSRDFLGSLARRYNVNLVGGSIINRDGDTIRNTSLVFDRTGNEVARYDKVHLFSPTRENERFQSGDRPVLFTLDGVRCGVVICYDIRFPEFIRHYALSGAEVLFVPAAWPHPRSGHWRLLNIARAVENQFFVAAVNQCGPVGKTSFCGGSLLVDPWGEVLAEGGGNEAIVQADFDLNVIPDVRERINVYRDRRPDIYGNPGPATDNGVPA